MTELKFQVYEKMDREPDYLWGEFNTLQEVKSYIKFRGDRLNWDDVVIVRNIAPDVYELMSDDSIVASGEET